MGAHEPLPPPLKRHRLSADDYQRMGQFGALAPDAHVELLDGEIIEMAPIGARHWATVQRLDEALKRALGTQVIVAVQTSFRLDAHSEPQPDVGVFRRRADYYASGLPTPADTLLVVEVADATARYDRQVKLPLYARAGIAELWIVDLEANLLRRFSEPRGDDYLRADANATPGLVELVALPGIVVDLTDLLGSAG